MGYLLSEIGYKKLLAKRERIHLEMRETQRKIGEVVGIDNDLRENPEYMELQNKATYHLPKQLSQVESVLSSCQVVYSKSIPKVHEKVQFGSRVTILYEDGIEERYLILGYEESDPSQHIISYLTPIAKAMIGLSVGDIATVQMPSKTKSLEVIAIENGMIS
jgi:transcription elongation GreA/GreB family factor